MEGRARPGGRRACWATRSRRCASSPCSPRPAMPRRGRRRSGERIGLAGLGRRPAAARRRRRGAATRAGSRSRRARRSSRGSAVTGVTSDVTWTDNHCHLDDERLEAARRGDRRGARGRGRAHDHGRHRRRRAAATAIDVAAAHDDVWATVGLHPHDAEQRRRHDRASCSTSPSVVAVGECGLDYHYDHSPRDVQRDGVRRADRSWPTSATSPLVIHTREAWDDTFDSCGAEGAPDAHGVPLLHRRSRRGRARASTSARSCRSAASSRSRRPPTCARQPRSARSTGCWSRPTALPRARAPPRQAQPACLRDARGRRGRRAAGHRRRRGGRGHERGSDCGLCPALSSPPVRVPGGSVELWRSLRPSGVASPLRCS